jgi:hypothetical protein
VAVQEIKEILVKHQPKEILCQEVPEQVAILSLDYLPKYSNRSKPLFQTPASL